MADPVSLMLASTAASSGLGLMQNQTQAAAQKAQANADEAAAQEARSVASYNDAEQQRKTGYLLSTQMARQAASGGGTGGSAAAVRAATAGRGVYNSQVEEWQGEQRGRKFDYEAQLADAAAQNTENMAPFQVGSTVLTGLTNASKFNAGFSKPGGWSGPGTGSASPWFYGQ